MPDYDAMTIGELHDAARGHGFTFGIHGGRGLEIGGPLMGGNSDRDRTTFAINAAIRRRWAEFVGFAELRLMAAGK